jgi:hypothetical protein
VTFGALLTGVSGVPPSFNSAEPVTILNVEPGG